MPTVKDGVYRHTSVRQALHSMQHGKCAYCEVKLSHHYSRVEHFRPKGGWQQRVGDALAKPGYWWLAYEWTNLFLSCEDCNERFKGNLFPVQGARATSPSDSLVDELAQLIDPVVEDPSLHLGFDEHKAVPLSTRGQETIDVLGLNGTPNYQANVDERRKAYEAFIDRAATLDIYRRFWTDLNPQDRSDARTIQSRLLNAVQSDHAYSAMFRAATAKYAALHVPFAAPLP